MPKTSSFCFCENWSIFFLKSLSFTFLGLRQHFYAALRNTLELGKSALRSHQYRDEKKFSNFRLVHSGSLRPVLQCREYEFQRQLRKQKHLDQNSWIYIYIKFCLFWYLKNRTIIIAWILSRYVQGTIEMKKKLLIIKLFNLLLNLNHSKITKWLYIRLIYMSLSL